jgi:uracil-DNA glycosylase
MLTSDRQSVGNRDTPNGCHPERSLALREANRQAKSKDPFEFALLEKSWLDIIGGEFDRPYMTELKQFLQQEEDNGHNVYPKRAEIFNALNLTPFEKVKVVILGQDPYHGEGQANGLCFSVRKGVAVPPSLKNIYKEIKAEYGEMPSHGDLTNWAEQGVLLLNATLTVRQGEAGSHQGKGWENFTDAIIRAISDKREHVVFLLWGSRAQEKHALIGKKYKVLEASHPSPFSVGRGLRDGEIHSFRSCGHFQKANRHLINYGLEPIVWQKI